MSAGAARTARSPASRFDLDGGALALFEAAHAVPLGLDRACRCAAGSAVDPAGQGRGSRASPMRMLRRGCEGMTAEQIDFRIDVLGAEMAVDTSPSTVAIHAQVIARNLDAFVELLARLLATPTFPRGRARAPQARDRRRDHRGARQRPRRRAEGAAAHALRGAPLRAQRRRDDPQRRGHRAATTSPASTAVRRPGERRRRHLRATSREDRGRRASAQARRRPPPRDSARADDVPEP